MPVDAGIFLWLVVLGGWVGIDATSFGQIMISRPFAAATLSGWAVGDPMAGAVMGIVLEAFHLGVLPFGAARYPEAGPAAVIAGAAFALGPQEPTFLLTILTFSLVWEWVGAESVRYLRQVNVHLVSAERVRDVDSLERRHGTAVVYDFFRGAVLVLLGWIVLNVMLSITVNSWSLGSEFPRLLVWSTVIGLVASSVRLFAGRAAWFVAGLAGGGLLLFAYG